MNTDHLKYLIEIGKTTSLQQASEQLFISPQALGKAMANLERELGMPLLIRSNSGVSLTINGQWLINLANQFLSEIENRKTSYKKYMNCDVKTPEGDFYLAFSNIGLDNNVIYDFLTNMSNRLPNLTLHISETSHNDLIDQIRKNTVNLGFSYRVKYNDNYLDFMDDDILWIPLQSGKLYLMTNENLIKHPAQSISLKKAVQFPLCCYALSEHAIQSFIYQILHIKISCKEISQWGYFYSQVQNGNYATLTALLDGASAPINTMNNVQLIKIRDDLQIEFGYLRPENESVLTENTIYIIRQLEDYLHSFNKK